MLISLPKTLQLEIFVIEGAATLITFVDFISPGSQILLSFSSIQEIKVLSTYSSWFLKSFVLHSNEEVYSHRGFINVFPLNEITQQRVSSKFRLGSYFTLIDSFQLVQKFEFVFVI
jgi:hypothetical protein